MFYFDFISMTEEEIKMLFIVMSILLIITIISYGIKYLFENKRKKEK